MTAPRRQVPAWYTNTEVCDYLLERCVAIHLDKPADKFSIIAVMLRKLFSLVQGKCVVEGVDSLMMHEIVLGGHLYLQLLKVISFLQNFRKFVSEYLTPKDIFELICLKPCCNEFTNKETYLQMLRKVSDSHFFNSSSIEHFLGPD